MPETVLVPSRLNANQKEIMELKAEFKTWSRGYQR